MKNWYSSLYKAFIMASIICFLLTFFFTGKTYLGSLITGYSTLTLGLLLIVVILMNNVLNINTDFNMSTLLELLRITGPFLLMLSIIGFILYLVIQNKKRIEEGHVANGYYNFSNIIIILFLLQTYLTYTSINNDKFETSGRISKVTTNLLYLLGVIIGICSLILFTILKYFSTDGFTVKRRRRTGRTS
jgi:hypothetical protein